MVEVNAQNAADVAKKVKAGELPGPAKSLAEAMHRVMTQVGYIQKKGTVTVGQGYKFAGEAQFIEAIRPELVAQQIVVCPIAMDMLVNEVFPNSSGKPQNRVMLRVTFRFTHAASGQTLDVQTCGEGIDNGDKATNKAMTGAMKYALRQAFVIETGNDPDETPSAQQERAPRAESQRGQAPLADRVADAIRTARTRDELTQVYRLYERDLKAGLFSDGERVGLDGAFKAAGAKFPAKA